MVSPIMYQNGHSEAMNIIKYFHSRCAPQVTLIPYLWMRCTLAMNIITGHHDCACCGYLIPYRWPILAMNIINGHPPNVYICVAFPPTCKFSYYGVGSSSKIT